MEDRCWDRLGIDPTADIAAIKKAYAKQLKFNKPDKNPEGFRDLRAAYEQALDESYWYEDDDFVEGDLVEDASSATMDDNNLIFVEGDIEGNSPVDWYDDTPIDDIYYDNEDNAANEESAESEVDLDEAEVVPFFFEYSPWTEEWERAVEDTDATSDNSDEHLQVLLQSQLDTPRSLDEQKDFEEALLVWFSEKPSIFVLSYQLVRSHFRWDKRLEHWSRNDYPWYILESLDERYQHVSYFQSPTAFRGFLTQHFSTVASYFPLENSDETKDNEEIQKLVRVKRSAIFRQLFFPFRVIELAQELKTLDAELDYHIHEHPAASEADGTNTENNNAFTARYWQQESPLKTLNDWVLNRFIEFEDFGLIAIIVAVVLTMFSLLFDKSWLSFYYDGIGVFVVVSLYYLFWQLQLRLFSTPDKFVSYEPWATGWRNASILLFILGYISWLDISKLDSISMPTSPVYFLTHLAGASLFTANSIRQSNFVVKAVSWHASVLLLLVAVFIPLFVLTKGQSLQNTPNIFHISPLFWLLLAAPAFLINLGDTYVRLEWLANASYKLIKVWNILTLMGSLLLFTYCADILPKMDFGFTAITIASIIIIMALSKSMILNSYDDI
ncbi:J domain-containing protein [Psychrobacter sp. B38]|uniref:J domain-containing protein n=1 Tax=Psychrobacter sp. B38 TaxID=3143538 RepID=UPI00321019B5